MLSVSRLVRVSVNLTPTGAAARSFGILMIAGDSNVINGLERYRTYNSIEAVGLDFGTTTPEYLAAALYFEQTPQPKTCQIGRWLRTASSGILLGGILTPTQQLISNFTGITTGSFKVTVDGVLKTLTGLDFSSQTNLNGVATVINGALTGAVCAWTGSRFTITSSTTGTSSTVSFAIPAGSGADISTLLQLTSALASPLVPGYASETPVQCAVALAAKTPTWYGLMFSASVFPTDDQYIAVCDSINAMSIKRIFGANITNTNVLDAAVTTDLASRMTAGGYKQCFNQYSANAYAIASLFGRAFAVDFNANRSTITLMYKQEPGVVAEDLTDTQANTLETKRCNVFTSYVNSTAIIEYGVMSGPAYFDEIHGLDWFQDAIQNACYNLLYTSPTKIPQTDSGVNQLVNAVSGACDLAVNNGLVAPGYWTAPGFGQLQQNQYLKSGYYIYAQPLSLQSQSDREARKAPPIQVAIKLAGAIQEVDVLVDVNR